MSAIPRFVRSDRVTLSYHGCSMTIKNICQKIEKYLRSIKTALKDSNSFLFVANINQNDPTCFSDHSLLLSYLSEQLLQICNSSRRYEFLIYFHSDKNAGTNVISSLLKMPPISRCSNFEITLYGIEEALQLPIETISDWLNRKKHDGRIPQEIFMTIYIYEIQNATEMCDHLSKVRFIFIVFLLPKPYFIFYGNIIKTRSFLRLGHCDLWFQYHYFIMLILWRLKLSKTFLFLKFRNLKERILPDFPTLSNLCNSSGYCFHL